jgi:endonuclease/exonuclease/phosphatase family metal-dependent hydrolase
MSSTWSIHGASVAALPRVSPEARAAMCALAPTRDTYRRLLGEVEGLALVETGGAPARAEPPARIRIGYWNIERFARFEPALDLIRAEGFDVLLLGEVDIGMARSGQRHALREAAALLGMSYAFGAEFLELGLGDETERRLFAGEENEAGWHGNAILSALPLRAPALIRLEEDGDWFDGRHGERRVGGRSAISAMIDLASGPVSIASVHLESHGGPELRAEHMGRLFAAMEQRSPGGRAAIGGDLNTSTLTRTATDQEFDRAALLAEDQGRFLRPEAREPLFSAARQHGYGWEDANAQGPTERTADMATAGRIDWFLIRGLAASSPSTIPAVDPAGLIIADHDAIAVTLEGEA